jgi:predicted nucleotidyltransferase
MVSMNKPDMDSFTYTTLATDPNVIFAILFGSHATGKARQGSDLDLAIYFNNPPTGFAILELRNELSNRAGIEVDLVILNSASAFLRHQVMKTGKKLVMNDASAYVRFRERTIADYQESKWWADRRAA